MRPTEAGDPGDGHQPGAEHQGIAERQNLTMRMTTRRSIRLTNGFSKKAENREAAMALHYVRQLSPAPQEPRQAVPADPSGCRDRRPHLDVRGDRRPARLNGW